ncbi:MAG: HK97 gp10 family phage protein [Clostridiales bacterium]|nr:HK97 gp10 family phage protein [Clostridiales bacterium]
MARMGSFDIRGLKNLQRNLNKIQEQQVNEFVEGCAKELAARLLAKVIKRTPVGDYSKEIEVTAKRDSKKHKKGDTYKKRINPTGKMGGTLRRGWTSQKGSGSEGLNTRSATQFVDTLNVNHFGDTYVIEIINPVEYASYVEYGHRTPDHKRWVKGHFMMTISEQEIQQIAPKVLEKKIKKFLGGAFNGQ